MPSSRFSETPAKWYALYTRSRAEKKLHTLLTQKNIRCYLPLIKTLQQRSDRKKWVELPLLPSYLFVNVTEKERFAVLNTPGAVRYVAFEGQAVPIPAEQIAYLDTLLNYRQRDVEVFYGSFAKGDQVEVQFGPLKGVKGEVVEIKGSKRLVLRLDTIGYCVHIETSIAELIPT